MKMSFQFFRTSISTKLKDMHAVCALRACPHTMLTLSVPQSRIGIRVGQLWYCSVDCFAEATSTRLSMLSDSRVMDAPRSPRFSIGLVMLSKGYLTDSQLRFAMAQSQLRGEDLEVTLVRLGLAGERQLTSARAAQWGCPVLAQDGMGQPVETDIPTTLLRICSAVPLHYSITTKRLLLGFVYRLEHSLLHALEQVMDCKVEPCFITPTEFQEQMSRLIPDLNCGETVLEDPMTPAQMSNALGGYAVDVAAKEVSFVNCRNYTWARLSGKRRKIDVLFRAKNTFEAGNSRNFSLLEENAVALV